VSVLELLSGVDMPTLEANYPTMFVDELMSIMRIAIVVRDSAMLIYYISLINWFRRHYLPQAFAVRVE
jgi:hypothetical protein